MIGHIPSAYFTTKDIHTGSVFEYLGYRIEDAYYQDIYETCSFLVSKNAFDWSTCWNNFAVGTLPPFFVSRISPPISIVCNNPATKAEIKTKISELRNSQFELKEELDEIESINRLSLTQTSQPVTSFGCNKGFLPEINYNYEKLKSFFEKNHQIRTNQVSFQKKFLAYIPIINDNYQTMSKEFTNILMKTLTGVLGYSESEVITPNIFNSDKFEFLTELKKNYEILFVNAHGDHHGHQNGVTSGDITLSGPKYAIFHSCSVGRFLRTGYLVGEYMFSGNTQFVQAGTTPIFASTDVDWSTILAAQGGTRFFEVAAIQQSGLTSFGDPTISLRPKTVSHSATDPKISFS